MSRLGVKLVEVGSQHLLRNIQVVLLDVPVKLNIRWSVDRGGGARGTAAGERQARLCG